MDFCISSSVLGSGRHLLCRDEGYQWVPDIPGDVMVLGEDNGYIPSVEHVAALFRQELPSFTSTPHAKFFKSIGLEPDDVAWTWALSDQHRKRVILTLLEGCRQVTAALEESGYFPTFQKRLMLLGALEKARIDVAKWREALASEQDETQRTNLKTFIPDHEGFADVAVYDGESTATGRLKIASGPTILTLRREHKKIIAPSSEEQEVFSVDFSSLEPRVALALNGHSPEGDVYEWVAQEIFDGKMTRQRAKVSTLSLIYGMSLHTAQRRFSLTQTQQRRVQEVFAITDVVKEIAAQGERKFNVFGRPIFPKSEDKLFNAYVQSSAVDVALLGFQDFIDEAESKGIPVRPLFVIHDELIFEAPSVSRAGLKKILSEGISVDIQGRPVVFPVKMKEVCE